MATIPSDIRPFIRPAWLTANESSGPGAWLRLLHSDIGDFLDVQRNQIPMDACVQVPEAKIPSTGLLFQVKAVCDSGVAAYRMLEALNDILDEVEASNFEKLTKPKGKHADVRVQENMRRPLLLTIPSIVAKLPREMITLSLTNGNAEICAVEMEKLADFSIATPIGAKVLVKDTVVRRGVIHLRNNNIRLLGGHTVDPPGSAEEFIRYLKENLSALLEHRNTTAALYSSVADVSTYPDENEAAEMEGTFEGSDLEDTRASAGSTRGRRGGSRGNGRSERAPRAPRQPRAPRKPREKKGGTDVSKTGRQRQRGAASNVRRRDGGDGRGGGGGGGVGGEHAFFGVGSNNLYSNAYGFGNDAGNGYDAPSPTFSLPDSPTAMKDFDEVFRRAEKEYERENGAETHPEEFEFDYWEDADYLGRDMMEPADDFEFHDDEEEAILSQELLVDSYAEDEDTIAVSAERTSLGDGQTTGVQSCPIHNVEIGLLSNVMRSHTAGIVHVSAIFKQIRVDVHTKQVVALIEDGSTSVKCFVNPLLYPPLDDLPAFSHWRKSLGEFEFTMEIDTFDGNFEVIAYKPA